MKTTKLPQSAWSDSQAAGSQSQQINYPNLRYLSSDKMKQTGSASYDDKDSYHLHDEESHYKPDKSSSRDTYFAYKRFDNSLIKATESAMTKDTKTTIKINDIEKNSNIEKPSIACGYKKKEKATDIAPSMVQLSDNQVDRLQNGFKKDNSELDNLQQGSCNQGIVDQDMNNLSSATITLSADKMGTEKSGTEKLVTEIPERVFMNGLIKHTAIALAIIIPLAAFSAYAAPMSAPSTTTSNVTTDKTTTATLAIKPSSIIHKSASKPTTVDSVDLEQYAGTWYEIGRLPMYFQRKCASDVTATYTGKTDGSGITVINKCSGENGTAITAEGLAKPADNTGSKLKVSFLPSWIRWLPVGRADYWVLARDSDYKTALVGTPDKKYLWLLARSPNITQQTYAKYREIAQQQGYDLKEFKLTAQSNQTVNLVP